MTSKDRINKIFNFETPDRVGIYDQFWSETRAQWGARLGIENGGNGGLEEYFGIDIAAVDKKDKPRGDEFFVLNMIGPFEDVVNALGLQNVLELIGADPADIISEIRRSACKATKNLEKSLKKNPQVDGVWLWSDMAGNESLFFSPEFYKNYILPFHKEICSMVAGKGLPVILHSDGNISDIIPFIVEAGFKAIHPVESQAGMRVTDLKKKYKGKIVFIGNMNMDIIRYARDKNFLSKVIKREIEEAKSGGGYIFGFESPLSPEIDLDMYSFVIDAVKEYGRY